ncbi:MAG: hypothetical protein LBL43_07860 [Treponema sp.]|jgi:hypothetical protein|nr:hypothetical protein [Treponema sp.]
MKNKRFLVLMILLGFAACDNGNTSGGGNNPNGGDAFKGTWVTTWGGKKVKVTAVGNSFNEYYVTTSGKEYWFVKGTYTISGDTVTMKVTYVNDAIIDNTYGLIASDADDWKSYADSTKKAKMAEEGVTSDTVIGKIDGDNITVLGHLAFVRE